MNAYRGLVDYRSRASAIDAGGDFSAVDEAITVFNDMINTQVRFNLFFLSSVGLCFTASGDKFFPCEGP